MKPGYKQTEVGVIPEEWDAASLDSCVRSGAPICYGILMPGPHCDGGVPVVKVRDIVDGSILEADLLLAHPTIDAAYKRSRLVAGDVLVTIRGTTGRVAVVSDRLNGANITQDTARLRINQRTDARFIFYTAQSDPVQHQIALRTIGQAVKGINIRDVRELLLAVPNSLTEQRAIAEALSDVDGLLGGLDRLIAKKRDLKQAAMQQLLTGQTRLPGFHGEWEVKRLGELARIQRGASPRPIESPVWFDENSSTGWVRISDVTRSGMFLRETTQRLSQLGVQHSRPVATGSLIMSICATVGRPVITEIDVCIHDGFVVFDNLQAEKLFIYYTLKWIEPSWSKHGQTGSQMNLNTGLINSTRISLPPLSEQTAIAEVLTDMDAELAALEQRRAKTRALKQGMMQELLTGRTRLVPRGVAAHTEVKA